MSQPVVQPQVSTQTTLIQKDMEKLSIQQPTQEQQTIEKNTATQNNDTATSDQNSTTNEKPNQVSEKDVKDQEENNMPKSNQKKQPTSTQQEEFHPAIEPQTASFVNVNRQVVQFGKTTLYPGSIQEVDVCIDLSQDVLMETASGHPFLLRVIAKCVNEEFNDLDQYVFSVRSNERYQYFQQVRFKIRAKQRAQVKVAVKVPPVKENYKISGVLQIQLENLKPLSLPITVNCQVPEVTCMKKLFKVDENTWMIKVPAKKNQIRMPPIPFKNLSNFSFTMQVEAITNQNYAKRPYDIIVQNFVNCQANAQFFVNLQLKENMNYQGPMPTKDTIRKILVLKIKNSSVYFNFPMEIQVFESSNNNAMG